MQPVVKDKQEKPGWNNLNICQKDIDYINDVCHISTGKYNSAVQGHALYVATYKDSTLLSKKEEFMGQCVVWSYLGENWCISVISWDGCAVSSPSL